MNRHELSSQAAKARREVAEVMASNQALDGLGIDGFGPDRTLVFVAVQKVRDARAQRWRLRLSSTKARQLARGRSGALVEQIRAATDRRLNVGDLYRTLALPPYGLRQGVAPSS